MTLGGGGTYGTGAGSSADVQRQAQRVPTDSGEQVAQHDAQQQFARPEKQAASLNETGTSILIKMADADTATEIDSITPELEQYWQDGGSKYNADLNARLLNVFASKIKALLTRAKGDCVTRDDLVAADLAVKLSEAASDFWKQVAATYRSRFGVDGETLLKDLADGKLSCRITLEFTSKIKVESPLGWELAEVQTAAPIVLLHDRRGRLSPTSIRLSGFGGAKYVLYEFQIKGCPVTKVTQYPTIPINFTGVYPQFDGSGGIYDLWLTFWELGAGFSPTVNVTVSSDNKACNTHIGITGGGDVWSGGFVLLHYPGGLKDWTFTSRDYPLVFSKAYTNEAVVMPGGVKATETGTYTITIRRGPGG
jgi:hypothetical protein